MAGTSTDKLAYLQETKEAIRQAITSKGVDVQENIPFRQYASKIDSISAGGVDITNCTISVHNLHMAEAEFYYNGSFTTISSTDTQEIKNVDMAKQIKAMDSSYGTQLPIEFLYDTENGIFKFTIYPV